MSNIKGHITTNTGYYGIDRIENHEDGSFDIYTINGPVFMGLKSTPMDSLNDSHGIKDIF